jgi:hypothetical protein
MAKIRQASWRTTRFLALAARSDVAIYAIGLLGREMSGLKRPNEAQFVLRRFAEQTGGRAFFPADAKELAGIYGDIKAELANQYFLNLQREGRWRPLPRETAASSDVADLPCEIPTSRFHNGRGTPDPDVQTTPLATTRGFDGEDVLLA